MKKTIEELSILATKGLPLSEYDLVEAAERVYGGGYSEEELDSFRDRKSVV